MLDNIWILYGHTHASQNSSSHAIFISSLWHLSIIYLYKIDTLVCILPFSCLLEKLFSIHGNGSVTTFLMYNVTFFYYFLLCFNFSLHSSFVWTIFSCCYDKGEPLFVSFNFSRSLIISYCQVVDLLIYLSNCNCLFVSFVSMCPFREWIVGWSIGKCARTWIMKCTTMGTHLSLSIFLSFTSKVNLFCFSIAMCSKNCY